MSYSGGSKFIPSSSLNTGAPNTPILDLVAPYSDAPSRTGRDLLTKDVFIFFSASFIATLLISFGHDSPVLSYAFTKLGNLVRFVWHPLADALDSAALTLGVCLPAALAVAILLHELGHALVATMLGFHVTSFRIGPLILGNKKAQSASADCIGFVTVRLQGMAKLCRRMFWVYAAGPIANLISVAIALVGINALSPTCRWGQSFLAVFAFLSLLLGIDNLRPRLTRNGVFRDGALMRMLRFVTPETKRFLAVRALTMSIERGTPIDKINRRWIRTAVAVSDSSADCITANLFAYLAAAIDDDVPQAAQHLERCLQLAPRLGPKPKSFYAYEAAVFQAWYLRDAAKAETWFQRVTTFDQMTPLMRLRYTVALHCANERYADAMQEWHNAMRLVSEMPDSPSRTNLEKGWLKWRTKIESRRLVMTAHA